MREFLVYARPKVRVPKLNLSFVEEDDKVAARKAARKAAREREILANKSRIMELYQIYGGTVATNGVKDRKAGGAVLPANVRKALGSDVKKDRQKAKMTRANYMVMPFFF